MALDGIYLRFLKNDMTDRLKFSKVDKIYQPSKEEIVLSLRGRAETLKLLINIGGSCQRAVLTKASFQNPAQPPMFCMLLRKHLSGGTLLDIRQSGMDRALFFDFSVYDELGDKRVLTLVSELTGRSGNLILFKEDGKIIDALRRTDLSDTNVRTILPGIKYEPLPRMDKCDISEVGEDIVIERLFSLYKEESLTSALMKTIEGLSPSSSEALCIRAVGGDKALSQITESEKERLKKEISGIKKRISGEEEGEFFVEFREGSPLSFGFLPPIVGEIKEYKSPSEAAEGFFSSKSAKLRGQAYCLELQKLISTRLQRVRRKLGNRQEDLIKSRDREKYRKKGELITANLYKIEKGAESVLVEDYYENPPKEIKISLDKRLSPAANAQKYYKEYNKLSNAEKALTSLIKEAEAEEEYLESVLDAISRCEGEADARLIKEELKATGYIKENKKDKRKPFEGEFKKAKTSDGFLVLIGRNNLQNDKLTMKTAENYDIWLHTKNIPGSHVIIRAEGKEISETAIYEAAVLAAKNSKASAAGKVAVDYTFKRYVKKPAGARPGKVIYTDYKTIYVNIGEL